MASDAPQPGCWRVLLGIGAAAGAISAVVGLVFLLFPRLKPAEPPDKRGVALSDVQVSFRASGDEAVWIFFKAQVDGYAGARLPVFWTLSDADTGEEVDSWPLSAPPLGAPTARHPGPILTPALSSELIEGEVHIPGRPRVDQRAWKVELEVVDAAGNRLARAETERFSVPKAYMEKP
jgi:hypothetical protein